MPVLPLVASMTVCPGFSTPRCSASSITPSASRSLTEPSGLKASILTKRLTSGGASLPMRTTGVLPTVSRIFANLPMAFSPKRLCAPRQRRRNRRSAQPELAFLLESVTGAQHGNLVERLAGDLESQRQSILEPDRHRHRRQSGDVVGRGVRGAV